MRRRAPYDNLAPPAVLRDDYAGPYVGVLI
jgi:hypothetical protein